MTLNSFIVGLELLPQMDADNKETPCQGIWGVGPPPQTPPEPSIAVDAERDPPCDQEKSELIPCVFTWTHGGRNVFLTGSFNNWSVDEKIRLVKSGHEFTCVKALPRGVHSYKFIVDDLWKFAPEQATQTDERGNINNVVDIAFYKPFTFQVPSDYEQAKTAEYFQYVPDLLEYSTDAPSMPILLSKSTCIAADPPPRSSVPLHSISNHVFHDAQAVNVFGPHVSCSAATHRWRPDKQLVTQGQKYCTTVYVSFNPLFSSCEMGSMPLALPNPLATLFPPRPAQDKQQNQDDT